jgi:hypothetical protein
LTNKSKAEFNKTKCRQMKKLDRLQEKHSPNSSPELDLSGIHLKGWVINLSKYKLTAPQTKVLAKGLNFAISPSTLPYAEYIVATEQACTNLPNSETTVLRAVKQNLTKPEQQALKQLKKEKLTSGQR